MTADAALSIIAGTAEGPVLATPLGLSFRGGVESTTARVIDAHHPLHGEQVAGSVLMMPTSQESCSGLGVMRDLVSTTAHPRR